LRHSWPQAAQKVSCPYPLAMDEAQPRPALLREEAAPSRVLLPFLCDLAYPWVLPSRELLQPSRRVLALEVVAEAAAAERTVLRIVKSPYAISFSHPAADRTPLTLASYRPAVPA